MVDEGSLVWGEMASAEAGRQRKGTGVGEWTKRLGTRSDERTNERAILNFKYEQSITTAQQQQHSTAKASESPKRANSPKHLRSLSPDNPSVGSRHYTAQSDFEIS